jgi:hypothetical protein
VNTIPSEFLEFSKVKVIQEFLKKDVKRSICMVGDARYFEKFGSSSEFLAHDAPDSHPD